MTIIYIPESVEPVTLDETKLALRVDGGGLDALLAGLITSAREQAEHITGRCYRPQVQRFEMADWPAADEPIALASASACAVTYWSGAEWVPLDGAAFVFVRAANGGPGTIVAPALGASWPALGEVAAGSRVRIDLTAGPESPADVPQSVKLYINAQVGAWLKTPEAIAGGTLSRHPLFDRLLDRERLWF